VAHLLHDAEGRQLRDHFNMTKWTKDEVVRKAYYPRIQYAMEEFGQEGINPPDETVLSMILVGVVNDDSFISHVLDKGEAEIDLPKLQRVCACTLYEEYQRAVDKGSWPEN
jgi:hypothetical protein